MNEISGSIPWMDDHLESVKRSMSRNNTIKRHMSLNTIAIYLSNPITNVSQLVENFMEYQGLR